MEPQGAVLTFLSFLLIGFLLFMLLRTLLLWYWKIKLIVQKLDGILNELKAKR